MLTYITRRILISVFTILVISFVSFVIIQLPDRDVADYLVIEAGILHDQPQREEYMTDEEIQDIRDRWGLDRPLIIQWADWVWGIAQGDWGYSLVGRSERISIKDVIGERLLPTVSLITFVLVFTWVFAIPVGIYSAVRQHSVGDYVFTFLGFSGLAVPDFLLALLLMYVLFDQFDMSVGGLFSGDYRDTPWNFARIVDLVKHLVLPGIVLGTAGTAGLIRIMRNNLLDELDKPYVVTARAKGVSPWKVIAKYPVRMAINPFISGIGAMIPTLISGTVIVSVVMSLPTLGPIMLEALMQQQPQLGGTIILLLGILTVVGTLISDLILIIVDPRIKLTGGSR